MVGITFMVFITFMGDTDIICSLKLTIFLELLSWKTVCFSEQIMPTDKYPSTFLYQLEAIVYIYLEITCDKWVNQMYLK